LGDARAHGEVRNDLVILRHLGRGDLHSVRRADGELVGKPVRTAAHREPDDQADDDAAGTPERPDEHAQRTEARQQHRRLEVVPHGLQRTTTGSTSLTGLKVRSERSLHAPMSGRISRARALTTRSRRDRGLGIRERGQETTTKLESNDP